MIVKVILTFFIFFRLLNGATTVMIPDDIRKHKKGSSSVGLQESTSLLLKYLSFIYSLFI